MTAWAVATTDRFKAAVMVSGISQPAEQPLFLQSRFHGFINGGPLTEKRYRDIALDRSPLVRLDKPTTPTLILHGADDRCTPLGQAQEFYAALVERGVPTRARRLSARGPWLPGARATASTRRRRTVAWFDRYLGTER